MRPAGDTSTGGWSNPRRSPELRFQRDRRRWVQEGGTRQRVSPKSYPSILTSPPFLFPFLFRLSYSVLSYDGTSSRVYCTSSRTTPSFRWPPNPCRTHASAGHAGEVPPPRRRHTLGRSLDSRTEGGAGRLDSTPGKGGGPGKRTGAETEAERVLPVGTLPAQNSELRAHPDCTPEALSGTPKGRRRPSSILNHYTETTKRFNDNKVAHSCLDINIPSSETSYLIKEFLSEPLLTSEDLRIKRGLKHTY